MNVSRIKRIPKRLPAFDSTIDLEVGCGDKDHRRKGYIGLDIEDYGQEIVWDVELGLPLPDNSCQHIYTSHTLEHIEDLIGVMNDFWRVLRPNGWLHIVVPHKDHERAYIASHVRFFDKGSFKFFEYESYADEYHCRVWEIGTEGVIVNDRKDIHVKMSPKK